MAMDEPTLLQRWEGLATWAADAEHGAAAALALMFALCLQRPLTANGKCVQHVGHRIWRVTTPYGTQTQKVSLFNDELTQALIKTVDVTKELTSPVYPRTPCGSRDVDVWSHSYASRKGHRGLKNFAALCSDWGVPARSPMDIYQTSMGVFLRMFALRGKDKRVLVARQLGKKRCPCVPMFTEAGSVGDLLIVDANTCLVTSSRGASEHRS